MGIAKAGKFVLHLAQQGSKIYLTAYLAARIVRLMDKELVSVSKEPNVKVFNAQNIDLSNFSPREAVYTPRKIYTQVIQVTVENIGGLSLEFETELKYANATTPYFAIRVQRQGENDGVERVFGLGDWIVSLWGEIHKFKDDIFQNTFDFVAKNDFAEGGRGLAVPTETFARGVLDFQKSTKRWAEQSSPDLEPLRAKLNTPKIAGMDVYTSQFQQNNRVHVVGTDMYGIVTVVGIDMGDRVDGVDVLLDNTKQYHTFAPEELEHTPYDPNTGTVEGPEGTQIIPKSDG